MGLICISLNEPNHMLIFFIVCPFILIQQYMASKVKIIHMKRCVQYIDIQSTYMLHNICFDTDSSVGCLYDRSSRVIVCQCIYLV
jgi:hypothetical protein